MKKVFILILFTCSVFAQTAGQSGLSFLKFGFGARNIALSDLGVVGTKDITALNYNPASLNGNQNLQLLFTHNEWIQDVRSENFGFGFQLFGLPFALGVNSTSISDIEVRTKPGEAQSKFNANYFYGSLSTGFTLYENLAVGATVKHLYEGIFSDEATGWAFDFGLQYEGIVEGLEIGASVKNIGSMKVLRTESTKLPVDIRFGAAYQYSLKSIESEILVLGGYQKYSETDDNHLHFGAEFIYKSLIAIRGGYVSGYESKNISAGLGIIWDRISFDYAFVPFDYNLGSSHILGLSYTFL